MSDETDGRPRTSTGKFTPKASPLPDMAPPSEPAPPVAELVLTNTAVASEQPVSLAPPPAPLQAESAVVKGAITADVSFAMPADHEFDPAAYAAEVERIKGLRKPFGAFTQKLALPDRRGYKRHWFNSTPGRVEQKLAEGWAHVTDSLGRPIKRVVGTGRDNGALIAYALEIPKVFFEEQQAAQHKLAQDKIDDIRAHPVRAQPGASRKSDKDKFYSPREEMVQVITDPVPTSQL